MIVSYLRVSTLNQEVGRQEYQLEKLKINAQERAWKDHS